MDHDLSGLGVTFVNCTLKRGLGRSHTRGLVDASAAIMQLARLLKQAGGVPGCGDQRSEWDAGARVDVENPEHHA